MAKTSKLKDAFEWLFNFIKEQGGDVLIEKIIEELPGYITEQFSDLNEQERKGLNAILYKFQLRGASLADCNTENEAFQAIARSIRELPLEKQQAVRDAVMQVLSQD